MISELEKLRTEAAALEAELARLEVQARELAASLGEFDHQARRHRDALERAGGRSRDTETALKALAANQALAGREREIAQGSMRDVEERLDAIRSRIAALAKGTV
ncbi:MAG: hypothetical protein GY791_15510 [Alphaproteobacteria bacterium]|nr:hypothetical protein [Alphaproteobacteria bacterium]